MTGLAVTGSTLFGALAAAALAVLGLHTSDDSSLTGGGSATSEPAVTPQRRSCGSLPRRLVWTLLLAIGGFGLVSGACLDACTGSNRIRHVPAIHGRVVDMETGRPIPSVRITRYFVREEFGGPGGGDQSIAHGSWHTATSSDDGNFRLPGWWGLIRGISTIKWGEFKPGWTAGWGYIILHDTPALDIAKAHPSHTSVQAETRQEGSRSTIILKLHRVNTPSTAEDHFWALGALLDERVVARKQFVTEAHTFLELHDPTEGMADSLSDLACRMGDQPERKLIIQKIKALCSTASPPAVCQHVGPRYVINVLAAKEAHQ